MKSKGGTIEEALFKLQELGLSLNEYKSRGINEIPLEQFENLLDFTIESLRACDDHFKKIETTITEILSNNM
jgi:hypothetical protein